MILFINQSIKRVILIKKKIVKDKKKFFLNRVGRANKISKSKIIKIIKIKKKLIEKDFKEVFLKVWNPLSIWKISFFLNEKKSLITKKISEKKNKKNKIVIKFFYYLD